MQHFFHYYHYIHNNIYFVIYYNSLQAYFLLPLHSENAWFAALRFGGYNMTLATLLAFLGSTLGMSINFGLGYYISRWRDELPVFSEQAYQRLSEYFRTHLYLLMAIPPLFILEFMPGLSIFVLVNGMFRVPPRQALAAIACARALYYVYYLVNGLP